MDLSSSSESSDIELCESDIDDCDDDQTQEKNTEKVTTATNPSVVTTIDFAVSCCRSKQYSASRTEQLAYYLSSSAWFYS